MARTSAQLIALACQTARAPGYTAQAGAMLNGILSDLCQEYDLEVARKTHYFNFSPTATAVVGPALYGGGPYQLPTDYLRAAGTKALTYWISGVPYMPIKLDIDQFDQQVQQAGNQSYPSLYTTDLSISDAAAQGKSPPMLFVFQPPSGAFAAQLRYFCQMADIDTPETSAVIPWFPSQRYLRKRLEADLMGLTGDPRTQEWNGAAEEILRAYLTMKDDPEGKPKTVKLDRQTFGRGSFNNLKNTKTIGW
jgi:hypothetical protein